MSPEAEALSRALGESLYGYPNAPATEQDIARVVVEQLGIRGEELRSEANFVEDLGADSLDMVELCMACEQEFGIEIPDEDAEKALTVQNLIELVDKIFKRG